ncbi:HAD hydrolase-like protein [Arthrobacter sp. OV608]|uniref:HAD hydrolase-like protein n=1 Tax=Arthrobacter sp. OV608 TaxID=1882768 RepID=UPI00256FA898|nr:HAD hydrolase-like protein [Arthrobacter sp. OV608]
MDGTLLNSAAGVIASAAKALAAVGAPVPSPEEMRRYVGPPMIESFRGPAGLHEETAQKALKHYRKAYADEGGGLSSLYEGIPEVLDQLKSAGIPVAVSTSKVEDQAVLMAQRFGLERYFVNICGASDLEGRSSKVDVIAELLLRLDRAGVDLPHPVMVGDGSYDVEGAAPHGNTHPFRSVRLRQGGGSFSGIRRQLNTGSCPGSLTARRPPVAQRAVRAQGPSAGFGRLTES